MYRGCTGIYLYIYIYDLEKHVPGMYRDKYIYIYIYKKNIQKVYRGCTVIYIYIRFGEIPGHARAFACCHIVIHYNRTQHYITDYNETQCNCLVAGVIPYNRM